MYSRKNETYPLISLTKDNNGNFPFPNMPCGVLPFYIQDNEFIWGCVESNRVGAIAVAPPAGTQDVIVYKGNERLVFEVAKPFPPTQFDCLQPFVGKNFSGNDYQIIVDCLLKNNFECYLENPIATAIHETFEENGVDLREKIGKNLDLLINLFEFEPQTIQAKRGTTTQKIIVAQLTGNENVDLKYTDKIEQKIPVNRGHQFYERGVWKTLRDLKKLLKEEQNNYSDENLQNITLSQEQLDLIRAELRAFASRIQLLDKIERSMIDYLKYPKIVSDAGSEILDFKLVDNKISKKETTQTFVGLKFLSDSKSDTSVEMEQSKPFKLTK